MKGVLKRIVPRPVRRALRDVQREAPVRAADFLADLRDRGPMPLPPASLRRRVGRSSSRAEFESDGRRIAESILAALGRQGAEPSSFRSILDFGVGCGRVARYLAPAFGGAAFSGADIDAPAVAWCARHLRGSFTAIVPQPPLPYEAAAFDFVYSVSVFTHLDEGGQFAWLEELHRVLAPGGTLLVTLHSPKLVRERGDVGEAERSRLEAEGFLFAAGDARFNDHSAFHSRDYVRSAWARWFRLVAHEEFGLAGYQDVAVLRKEEKLER